MRLLTPIQLLVIRTNAYWPCSRLNRLPYYLAIRMFKRLCARAPEVHSAYLRHSMAEGRWEPGLSDIDLTILLVPGMSRANEFAFISRFRRSFRRLARMLPMLSDLQILPLEYMGSWCLYSMRGRSVDRWVLLHGEDFRSASNVSLVRDDGFDRLMYAQHIYLDTFENRLLKPVWGPLLESRFIRRLLFKIQHFTGVEPRNYGNPEKVGTPDEIRLKIIRAIESAAADLLEPGPTPPFGGAAFKSPANPIPVLGNREATRALLSLLEVGNDFHAVLDPDAPDSELLRDLALLDHLRNQGSGKLIVLGPLGYEFYVRIKEPFLYDHLAHERSMRFGEDPIPGISPPPGEAYFNRIVSQFSMALAAFPFGGELLKLSDGPAVMSRVYRSILKRTLLIRYLIEGGQIPRSNGQLNKACYERYSRVFEQFDLLTQSRPSNLAFRMYQVYREHLDFINRNMSKLPSHEGSLRTALL